MSGLPDSYRFRPAMARLWRNGRRRQLLPSFMTSDSVMPGHPSVLQILQRKRRWIAGSSPAMTTLESMSRADQAFIQPSSRPRALAAARVELDGAVRDGDLEGGADRALNQGNLAAMGAHQLGGDRQPKPGAAGAGRALERFEQMDARLLGNSRPGIGHFDHHHGALPHAGDADLIARRI